VQSTRPARARVRGCGRGADARGRCCCFTCAGSEAREGDCVLGRTWGCCGEPPNNRFASIVAMRTNIQQTCPRQPRTHSNIHRSFASHHAHTTTCNDWHTCPGRAAPLCSTPHSARHQPGGCCRRRAPLRKSKQDTARTSSQHSSNNTKQQCNQNTPHPHTQPLRSHVCA
jgi:hypothetical protein